MIKIKTFIGSVARLGILYAAMTLSTYTCAATLTLSPSGASGFAYLSINFTRESGESISRPFEIAGALPTLEGPALHPALSVSNKLVHWYGALGRDGHALAFELLLIACYIVLRICSKRRTEIPHGDLIASAAANKRQ